MKQKVFISKFFHINKINNKKYQEILKKQN